MERGILLEVRGRQGILLIGTGEFRRVALPVGGWQVGDEIAAPLARAGRPWLRTVVAAAAAFLVLFGGPAGYWQWSLLQPSVVLAMEINPTLEFTLNGKGNVMNAVGLNDDGKLLLQELDWQNRPFDQVAQAVTRKAVAVGKLDPASIEGAIVVTVAPVQGEKLSETKVKEISQTAQVAVEAAVKAAAAEQGKSPQAQVASVPTTRSEVEEARAEGLTLPEYVLYKSLQDSHPEVKPEDFQHKGPGAALKGLGILPAEALSEVRKDRGQESAPGQQKKENQGQGKDEKAKPANQPTPADSNKGNAPDKHGDKNAPEEKPGNSSNKDDKRGNSSNKDDKSGNSSHKDNKENKDTSLLPESVPVITVEPTPQPNPDDKGPGRGSSGSDSSENSGRGNGNGKNDDDNKSDSKGRGNSDDKSDSSGGNGGNSGKNDDKGNGKKDEKGGSGKDH